MHVVLVRAQCASKKYRMILVAMPCGSGPHVATLFMSGVRHTFANMLCGHRVPSAVSLGCLLGMWFCQMLAYSMVLFFARCRPLFQLSLAIHLTFHRRSRMTLFHFVAMGSILPPLSRPPMGSLFLLFSAPSETDGWSGYLRGYSTPTAMVTVSQLDGWHLGFAGLVRVLLLLRTLCCQMSVPPRIVRQMGHSA